MIRSPSPLAGLFLVCAALSPTLCAVDIVGDANIYTTGMGATRVGFLNPGGSSSPTTYFGMWYDAANNRGVIEALSGGVAWRPLALNSSGKQPVYIGGALGVGIATPASLGSGGNPTILQVHGTGTGQPYGLIEVSSATAVAGNPTGSLDYGVPNVGRTAVIQSVCTNGTSLAGYLDFFTCTGGVLAERMRITDTGNVGIGVLSPTSALAVNGTISAKEVKVVASPADYVFADGYRLRSLAEVEAYITENHHLPGVASAKEQEEQGVLVADLMRAHLEKIEELNLYVIQLQKDIAAQRRANDEVAAHGKTQDAVVAQLLARVVAMEQLTAASHATVASPVR